MNQNDKKIEENTQNNHKQHPKEADLKNDWWKWFILTLYILSLSIQSYISGTNTIKGFKRKLFTPTFNFILDPWPSVSVSWYRYIYIDIINTWRMIDQWSGWGLLTRPRPTFTNSKMRKNNRTLLLLWISTRLPSMVSPAPIGTQQKN